MVIRLLRSNSTSSGLCSIGHDGARLEKLQAAEERVAAERHGGMGSEIGPVGKPLVARQADLGHQAVHDDAGRRKRRERAGLRAVADHDDHQKRGNGRAACHAIAIGPSSAAVETFPGPIDASAHPRTKNMIGMSPALPRQTRTARWAMRSSVPVLLSLREQQRHARQA